jgi:hypothetical protein
MGHLVSDKGIGPTEEKVKAVVDAREPKTASEVRRFLSLVNFCSLVIPDLFLNNRPISNYFKMANYRQINLFYADQSAHPYNLGCDIKIELVIIKDAMYQAFIDGKQLPIYARQEFRNFCLSSGAPTFFDKILSSVTNSQHLQNRIQLNEKRVVSFIYKMCYCLRQQCNDLQVDHALYLNSNHMSQEGIDKENHMGNTCC